MLYLVGFVAFVIALLWLCQIVLLDDFYRYFKTTQLKSSAETLMQNLDNEDADALAEQLAKQNEICILLLDEHQTPLISCEGVNFCLIHRMSPMDLDWWAHRAPEDGTPLLEMFTMVPQENARYDDKHFEGRVPPADTSRGRSLLYVRHVTLADNTEGTLMLNVQITPVDATVSTLRSQLLLITLIVLLAALLLAALISRNISRPIIETNDAARALSRGQYDPPAHSASYREIKELNDTLVQAAAELSQVEHLQQELIANISHDLRTPLTMIGGYAEVMRDIPTENTPENMQIVIDETKRLSSLVNELLDFSKLQAGAIKMVKSPFCLTDSIAAILTRYNKLTEQDGYHIEFAPDRRVTVLADEARVEQVIYNLVNNALTYTGADKRVVLTQETAGERVRISIRDSGQGIPPDELALIWNRYYRSKENHKRAIQGSGLGLSIVRSILESHGAPYGVTSAEGEGTCFWFELPLADENTPLLPEKA